MKKKHHLGNEPFISADKEAEILLEKTKKEQGSCKIAFLDQEFLLRRELRAVRAQLELLKPDLIQQEHDIEATIVVFGSARIKQKKDAEDSLQRAEQALSQAPDDLQLQQAVKTAQALLDKSHYYDEAREFGRIVSEYEREKDAKYVVITGGGPGIMEAANRGAYDVQAPSVALTIVLANEEKPNPYVYPDLTFKFHYFAMRKMHFLFRSRALVAFPGGFGTLDELFETLTLMQTKKLRRLPILLFGKSYWDKIINFQALVDEGVINHEDLNLFAYVETAQEAWEHIVRFYSE